MKPPPLMTLIGVFLIVALLALGAYLWTPDKTRTYLEERYLLRQDEMVVVLGSRMRVRDTGPKDASRAPVILLHGFGASLETWQGWAGELEKDRRVIRFDLPGSGLSFPDIHQDYRDVRTMALVAALMDQKGISRADVIGNSIGGRIAWQFASIYPQRVRKLVLVSPDGFASPGFDYGKAPKVPAVMSAMLWTLPKFMVKANLDPSYGDPKRLTGETLTRYHDLMLGPGSRAALLKRMEQTVLVDPATQLPKIMAPTMLLWGKKDAMIPITNAQDYLALLPNASLVALDELGHVPFEEDPDVSLRPVRAFLNGT